MKLNNPKLSLTFLGGDTSSSSLEVTSQYILKEGVSSTFQLFSSLKSSSRQISLSLKRKTPAIESIIKTEGDIKAVLTDGDKTIFTGFLSTNFSWTLGEYGEEALSITIEDVGSKLLGKAFIKSGSHLFKCSASNAIKAVCDKAGVELSSSIPTISTNIVKVVGEGETCKDILSTMLYELGYVYYFEDDGKMNLFSFLNLPKTESIVLNGTSIVVKGSTAISLSKSIRQYNSAKVKFTELGETSNYLVYRNTTNKDSSHPYCNLVLKSNEAFDGSEIYAMDESATRTPTKIEAVNAASETDVVGSRKIIAIENVSSVIEKYGSITASIVGSGGPYLEINAQNKSNSAYAITRLDAYADVLYEKATSVVLSGDDTTSSDNTLEEEMKYIHAPADVKKHASLIAQYYKYSSANYTFYKKEDIVLGSVVRLNDDVHTGLNVLVLVYAKIENDTNGIIEYKAVGYSEFDFDKASIITRQLISPVKDMGAKGEKGDAGSQGAKGDKGETGATGAKGDTGATGSSIITSVQYLLNTSSSLTESQQASLTTWVDGTAISWSYGYYIYKRLKKENVDNGSVTYTYLGRDTAQENYYKSLLSFSITADRSTYFKNLRAQASETTTIQIKVNDRYYSPSSINWTLNGTSFSPTYSSGLYSFTVPLKNPKDSYTVKATPVKNSSAITGASSSIVLTVVDITENYKFFGSVTSLSSVGSGQVLLDGDSCFLTTANAIYVYQNGSWVEFNSCTLSDDIKTLILSKAQKAAFEYAENNELSQDYGYFKTLVAKYIYARNIGVEDLKLDEGGVIRSGGYLVDGTNPTGNSGIYIDADGKVLMENAQVNGSFSNTKINANEIQTILWTRAFPSLFLYNNINAHISLYSPHQLIVSAFSYLVSGGVAAGAFVFSYGFYCYDNTTGRPIFIYNASSSKIINITEGTYFRHGYASGMIYNNTGCSGYLIVVSDSAITESDLKSTTYFANATFNFEDNVLASGTANGIPFITTDNGHIVTPTIFQTFAEGVATYAPCVLIENNIYECTSDISVVIVNLRSYLSPYSGVSKTTQVLGKYVKLAKKEGDTSDNLYYHFSSDKSTWTVLDDSVYFEKLTSSSGATITGQFNFLEIASFETRNLTQPNTTHDSMDITGKINTYNLFASDIYTNVLEAYQIKTDRLASERIGCSDLQAQNMQALKNKVFQINALVNKGSSIGSGIPFEEIHANSFIGAFGGETLKLYLEGGNEVNFGGTSDSSTIYFGYTAKDSKPIPAKIVFGGSSGKTALVASSFTGNVNAEGDTKHRVYGAVFN